MPLCEHPWYGVAHCRQELHATISSVVVSRYTRFDSLVAKHIALFLWTTNLEAVSVLLLLRWTVTEQCVHLLWNSRLCLKLV